jgi:folate-binding protein YgfZ
MRFSPLRTLHEQAGASFAPYGPPEAACLVVETFGELGVEYAALRNGGVLLDQPHRAVLEITGPDRLEFLNRMVTQELKGFEPGQVRRSFWLNRKGRIDADLRLIELGGPAARRTLAELDVYAVDRTIHGLAAFIITEDVQIADASESRHRLALHGATSRALLAAANEGGTSQSVTDLAQDRATTVSIAGHEVTVFRDDTAGEPGLELIVPAAGAAAVYQRLLEIGHGHECGDATGLESRFRLRPAGWHAYNIGRIEAGIPLYNIDFGPDSLPHETGVLHDRVNFRKGCYLGQEIVARMESRGHSKKSLVALKCEVADANLPAQERPLPEAGAQVWRADAPDGEPVGVVTSSTLAPMLGWTPVCFGAVKPGANAPGTELVVEAGEDRLKAAVQTQLRFWAR